MTGFRCLAIETATERAGIAVITGDEVLVHEEQGLRAPSRLVYQWTDDLLRRARLTLADLDCIAFGAGPGSFTGLRVAAGVAQAFGYARNLPVCRVSTLAALALGGFRQTAAEQVAAALDARMGGIYVGVYRRSGAGVVAVEEDALLAPADWMAGWTLPTCAIGPGWTAWPAMLERAGDVVVDRDPGLLPSVRDVGELARLQFEAGMVVSAREAVPNYLRERVTS